MAQATGTHSRYDLNAAGDNVKRDLSEVITMIDPTDTPLQSMIASESSGSTVKEWPMDSLAAASTSNAHIDGDVFSGDTLTAPVILQNHHQIFRKDLIVTRRAQTVRQAGTKNELSRQIVKAGKELKRDIEATITNNQAVTVGDDSTAPKLAGLPAWLKTNTDRGATGTDPTLSGTTYGYPNAAAGNGTNRAVSEATLLGIVKDVYVQGGSPEVLMMGPAMKQKFSQFQFSSSARIATPYQDHGKSPKGGLTVNGAVDIYVTDFGTLEIVVNRFQSEEDIYVLEKDKLSLSYITKYEIDNQHKDGDADRRMLVSDVTLCVKDEAALGIHADSDSTTAVVA
ncbi:MAG: hypothetical protein EP323_00445 [Gammaproteobacteria bacterium]|nr:MAG: hypothetical protein EP323_00445 [Gammaproteobacteria bacterium]